MSRLAQFSDLDAAILAVPHRQYLEKVEKIVGILPVGGILADIRTVIDPKAVPGNLRY